MNWFESPIVLQRRRAVFSTVVFAKYRARIDAMQRAYGLQPGTNDLCVLFITRMEAQFHVAARVYLDQADHYLVMSMWWPLVDPNGRLPAPSLRNCVAVVVPLI